MKVKIIKQKEFTANNEQHKHYTIGYKGRVFGVNTLKFDKGDLTESNGELEIKGMLEVMQDKLVDQITGEVTILHQLVPKLDIPFATY